MKGRKFSNGSIQHIYQREKNGNIIFYDVADGIVLFDLIRKAALKYNVAVYSVCFMPNHIHLSVLPESLVTLRRFVAYYSSRFSLEYNSRHGTSGRLFAKSFGSASKQGGKLTRTNFIYVDNNPVEKKLCRHASEYRWNFLAYAGEKHPFSAPIAIRRTSYAFRKALKMTDFVLKTGAFNYTLLENIFSLGGNEEWFTDYIISKLLFIRHEEKFRLFGGRSNYFDLLGHASGSEYDIEELFEREDDSVYPKMISFIRTHYSRQVGKFILNIRGDEQLKIITELHNRFPVSRRQLEKFFHL